jgi:hypothetical protein
MKLQRIYEYTRTKAARKPSRQREHGARRSLRFSDAVDRPAPTMIAPRAGGVAQFLGSKVEDWSRIVMAPCSEAAGGQRSTLSSTISARNLPCSAVMRPTVTGRPKRRGPALPGLKKSVPFFVSIFGWCE